MGRETMENYGKKGESEKIQIGMAKGGGYQRRSVR